MISRFVNLIISAKIPFSNKVPLIGSGNWSVDISFGVLLFNSLYSIINLAEDTTNRRLIHEGKLLAATQSWAVTHHQACFMLHRMKSIGLCPQRDQADSPWRSGLQSSALPTEDAQCQSVSQGGYIDRFRALDLSFSRRG